MSQFNSAFTLFMSLLVEAFPFLLLGVLLSSALQVFVNEKKMIALLPRNPLLGSIVGSCVGFLFPACECGNVPVARRLLLQGAPAAVAVGFLLAAPTVNPIVIWATWTAFRDQPEIVVWRIGLSLAIAIIMGWVFSVQKDLRPLLQPAVARAIAPQQAEADPTALLQGGGTFMLGGGQTMSLEAMATQSALTMSAPATTLSDRLQRFLENTFQELRELGSVLILGSAIASCIQVFVPREIILDLGQDAITSVLAMMLLAAVVSICSTVDSFFALSFASTFTSGSLLAFLVFGPMIDLKAIGLMFSVFRVRALVYFFLLIAQLVFISTVFINLQIS